MMSPRERALKIVEEAGLNPKLVGFIATHIEEAIEEAEDKASWNAMVESTWATD